MDLLSLDKPNISYARAHNKMYRAFSISLTIFRFLCIFTFFTSIIPLIQLLFDANSFYYFKEGTFLGIYIYQTKYFLIGGNGFLMLLFRLLEYLAGDLFLSEPYIPPLAFVLTYMALSLILVIVMDLLLRRALKGKKGPLVSLAIISFMNFLGSLALILMGDLIIFSIVNIIINTFMFFIVLLGAYCYKRIFEIEIEYGYPSKMLRVKGADNERII